MKSNRNIDRQNANPTYPRNIDQRELRRFLAETANLPDLQQKNEKARAAWRRFAESFGSWIRSLPATNRELSEENGSLASPFGVKSVLVGAWLGNLYAGAVYVLSRDLQLAWEKPARQGRETGILATVVDLAQLYATGTGRRFALVQEPIGQALLEAIHAADLMRVCLNPECPARYFFADRRTQKFCSEKCAEYAQREYKRRWWNAHGSEWRRGRQQDRKSVRRRGSREPK